MPTNNICWEQGNNTWKDVEVAGPGDLYEGRPGVMRSAVSLSSLVLHDGIRKLEESHGESDTTGSRSVPSSSYVSG